MPRPYKLRSIMVCHRCNEHAFGLDLIDDGSIQIYCLLCQETGIIIEHWKVKDLLLDENEVEPVCIKDPSMRDTSTRTTKPGSKD